MRILLVRPPRIAQAITLGEFMFSEPIGLEMVYAVLSPLHQVEIMDMMADSTTLAQRLAAFRPQVVGITSLCIDVLEVLRLAQEVKDSDGQIVTVVGGTQAFLVPSAFFADTVDYIFRFTTQANLQEFFHWLAQGEGESRAVMPTIPGVLDRRHGYAGQEIAGRNEYILPDRSSTQDYRQAYSYFGYRPAALLGTAQGCSRGCKFCLRWRIEGGRETYRPLPEVVAELAAIAEPTVMIFDNDFIHNGHRLQEFCQMTQQRGIAKRFICYASVPSVLANGEALGQFRQQGLQAVLLGYESFSGEELAAYGKNSTPQDNLAAAALLRSLGVDVWASVMLHPDWGREDFRRLRRHLRELRPQITSMCPLTPFPTLPLLAEYRHRLVAEVEDYPKWSFGQLTIRPSQLTTRQYYQEMLKINLYINLYMNNPLYIVRKFGVASLGRLLVGSLKVFWRYVQLMRSS